MYNYIYVWVYMYEYICMSMCIRDFVYEVMCIYESLC